MYEKLRHACEKLEDVDPDGTAAVTRSGSSLWCEFTTPTYWITFDYDGARNTIDIISMVNTQDQGGDIQGISRTRGTVVDVDGTTIHLHDASVKLL